MDEHGRSWMDCSIETLTDYATGTSVADDNSVSTPQFSCLTSGETGSADLKVEHQYQKSIESDITHGRPVGRVVIS